MADARRCVLVFALVGLLLLGCTNSVAFAQAETAPNTTAAATRSEDPCSPPPSPGVNFATLKEFVTFVVGTVLAHKLPLPAELLKFAGECAAYLGVFQPYQENVQGGECLYGPDRAGIIYNNTCLVPVDSTLTSQDGQLIYLTAHFPDTEWATGFGFRGANGSGWAEENHPFSSPSYGRVGPGQVTYPFNHGCGTSRQTETDVEFWINSVAGRGPSTIVHLKCNNSPPVVVPNVFLGVWNGAITQQNPPIPPFTLSVTITQGLIGSTVASGHYTGTSPCDVHWTLLSTDPGRIVVNEVVDSGSCFDNVKVTLSQLDNGTLDYDFENGNGRGTLSH